MYCCRRKVLSWRMTNTLKGVICIEAFDETISVWTVAIVSRTISFSNGSGGRSSTTSFIYYNLKTERIY